MKIKQWIAENVGYRFPGCLYSKFQDSLFNFIESRVPQEFFNKDISDLGCGDGSNTLRIKKIFKAKKIVGYDRNDYLLEKAGKKGLETKKLDLNTDIPQGEVATFSMSLHHLKDKEKVLRSVIRNFGYLFLCEPVKDLYHAFFDAGTPLKRERWIDIFDKVFREYTLYQFGSNLIVFYRRDK